MKSFVLLLSALFFFSTNVSASVIDLVVVKKSQYSLTLYSHGIPVKRYWVALGPNPRGPKVREGDMRTPEGRYLLDYKKDDSSYYKAFHISYPNVADIERARKLGVNPGGSILLHGQRKGSVMSNETVQQSNWTNGCIALVNKDMDELSELVQPGTPIEIRP